MLSVLVLSTVQQGGEASRERDRNLGECAPPGGLRTEERVGREKGRRCKQGVGRREQENTIGMHAKKHQIEQKITAAHPISKLNGGTVHSRNGSTKCMYVCM